MHPVLGHYLDVVRAQDTLKKIHSGAPVSGDDVFFAEAASANPEEEKQVAGAGKGRPSPETQQALLVLATHAALRALLKDPELSAPLQAAKAALLAEEASDEEADQFLASLILEEGFGDGAEVETFDRDVFREMLDEVPNLARLTAESVGGLIDGFAQEAPESSTAAFGIAMDALLQIAWEEGPTPFNSEHVQTASEVLGDQGLPPALLEQALVYLSKKGLIGPRRLQMLSRGVQPLKS